MAVKLAETTFCGDIHDFNAIRNTTAKLLNENYGKDSPYLANVETVDVWVYDPEFGWDKTAIFTVKDLLK